MIQLNFDASTVDPNPKFSALPSGWYTARIIATEQKPAKSNPANEYLQVTLEVLDGPHPGTKVFTNLNLQNTNPVAQEIAYKSLSQICHAVNIIKLATAEQLHGIPMAVKLMFKPEKDGYNASNEVKEYRPYGQAPSAPPAAVPTLGNVAPTTAPAWAQPAGSVGFVGQPAQPAPMAMQVTGPAGGPWAPVPVQQPAPAAQSAFPTFQQAPQANPHVPQVPLAQTAPIQPVYTPAPAPAPTPAPAPVAQPAPAMGDVPPWERQPT